MDDVFTWVATGLAAGGLAGAAEPGQPVSALLGVAGAGLLGALAGGWVWATAFGSGPATFLGAALVGVLGALAALAALRQARGGAR